MGYKGSASRVTNKAAHDACPLWNKIGPDSRKPKPVKKNIRIQRINGRIDHLESIDPETGEGIPYDNPKLLEHLRSFEVPMPISPVMKFTKNQYKLTDISERELGPGKVMFDRRVLFVALDIDGNPANITNPYDLYEELQTQVSDPLSIPEGLLDDSKL